MLGARDKRGVIHGPPLTKPMLSEETDTERVITLSFSCCHDVGIRSVLLGHVGEQ